MQEAAGANEKTKQNKETTVKTGEVEEA